VLFRSRTAIVLVAASIGWRAGSGVGSIGIVVDGPRDPAAGRAAAGIGAEASGSGATAAAGTVLNVDRACAASGCAGGALLDVAGELFGHGVQAGGDGEECP
jgi:hypothetical protein